MTMYQPWVGTGGPVPRQVTCGRFLYIVEMLVYLAETRGSATATILEGVIAVAASSVIGFAS